MYIGYIFSLYGWLNPKFVGEIPSSKVWSQFHCWKLSLEGRMPRSTSWVILPVTAVSSIYNSWVWFNLVDLLASLNILFLGIGWFASKLNGSPFPFNWALFLFERWAVSQIPCWIPDAHSRRWFKMLLAEITPTRVFLDSDDVSKLDAIINVSSLHWLGWGN